VGYVAHYTSGTSTSPSEDVFTVHWSNYQRRHFIMLLCLNYTTNHLSLLYE
jgi:hypothetical protein